MSSRTRVIVMAISAPVIAFAIVGGFLGRVMAGADNPTFQNLKIFDDVVNLITTSYVEDVNVDKVMKGAMHGLADGLDADSAYLTVDEVKQVEGGSAVPAGGVGLELTRQYYLRVIAARDGSPAAKAGLQTGDYIRMIGDTATRDMSVWEGMRALRGAPGTTVKLTVIRGNAQDPHVVELKREAEAPGQVTGRIAAPGVGYLRIPAMSGATASQLKSQTAELAKQGADRFIVDIRRVSTGAIDDGIAVARVFVANGTIAIREAKGGVKETVSAASGDGAITQPVTLLVDTGTSGAAEVFAAALAGNKRADIIGEHTIGRAAVQKLVKLPDGSGLWLSTIRILTPGGTPLHEKGLEPTVAVDEPEPTEFGAPRPTADPIMDKALERLNAKKAA
ncbi:MAG TPA: S41 family peptidase [Vicinamibacterales bacterium]|nr:S41 family peptidase [Vicinamibacterales bacterium]